MTPQPSAREPNRCPLCGAKTRGSYCWAHSWAAGEGHDPIVARPAPAPKPARAPQPAQPLVLVAGASTGSGRRLVARKTA